MARLDARKRARLPDRAFAYVDSQGRRRLPIHDKAHVKNALSRFNQVAFESDGARERARRRLLIAARKYRIVPVGFVTGQLESERRHATAGRLVIELGQNSAPGALPSSAPGALSNSASGAFAGAGAGAVAAWIARHETAVAKTEQLLAEMRSGTVDLGVLTVAQRQLSALAEC